MIPESPADPLFHWRGLRSCRDLTFPLTLRCERGVWGKAPGARSDYRWLAASKDLLNRVGDLGRDLAFGQEDDPRESVYWKAWHGEFFAVKLYPSRAHDATRRTDFTEKQVLTCSTPEAQSSPALLALALLPGVAALNDSVWYDRRQDGIWGDHSYVMEIPPEACPEITVTRDDLDAWVHQGLADLRERTTSTADLANLCSRILRGDIAWLRQVAEPLPPMALAVLLLDLEPEVAARLSMASWFPSSRIVPNLTANWNVLMEPVGRPLAAGIDSGVTRTGEDLARRLLNGVPEPWVSESVSVEPKQAEEPKSEEEMKLEPRPKIEADSRMQTVPVEKAPPMVTAPMIEPVVEPLPDIPVKKTPPIETVDDLDVHRKIPSIKPSASASKPPLLGPHPREARLVRMQEKPRPLPKMTPSPTIITPKPPIEVDMHVGLGPGTILQIDQLSSGLPALRALYRFACSPDRRWFEPDTISDRIRLSHLDNKVAHQIERWVHQLQHRPIYMRREPSLFIDKANHEHWTVKIDILRSTALVLAPAPEVACKLERPRSHYIPPLFMGRILADDERDELARRLGLSNLRELIHESLKCSYRPARRKTKDWLRSWSKSARYPRVESTISDALSPR